MCNVSGFFEAPAASACLFSMTQTEPLPPITLVFCAIEGLTAMKVRPLCWSLAVCYCDAQAALFQTRSNSWVCRLRARPPRSCCWCAFRIASAGFGLLLLLRPQLSSNTGWVQVAHREKLLRFEV